MKKLWRACLTTGLLVSFGVAGAAAVTEATPQLLADLDLPLMPGFHEDNDSRVVFDTPEGRIIETRASGPATLEAVRDYYLLVLPTLSWQLLPKSTGKDACAPEAVICITARREAEILSIGASSSEGKSRESIIIFDLRPQ